ncbi:MAG TPA: tRNA (N6-isopentenyl adenosine(37)-C2)-methylthiotransferase MiaB [Firmicutes bacterium]|nr:tRNA (N6-isopentenyl adenosine(37)-C2)-methylthiotransferase MiaB [Bacillota bacterium]
MSDTMNLPNLNDAKKRTKETIETIYLANEENNNLYQGKKYFLRTYGCQMNVHDSEEIKYILENLGYTETDELESSDIVVLNTCAIRENAHDKVFGYLGRCKHLKNIKKDLIVCIGGCMAQEEVVVNEIRTKHPYVDIIFGTHNIYELASMIKEHQNSQNIKVYSEEGKIIENVKYKRDSKINAWVNIMYGCDKFCTYCIVPYTRGRQRSRASKSIIEEVEKLVKEGYQEVTLLGQNVNAYGKDLENEVSFAKLLEMVSDTKIPRVRFVTSHPWDFTDEMIDIIAKRDNIMPYIHLPLQSGSSRILKLMGRRYTKEEYLTLFDKMKEKIPNVAISTDIIVGFPGETENDFKETLEVVNHCKYDGAYTFIFSPRVGTPAAKMEDNTPLKEKEQRLHELNQLVNKYSLENNEKLLNKVVPVLIQGISEKDNTKLCGYTDTMKLVNVEGTKDLIGKIVNVKITEAKSFSLDGIAI